jgi:PAS domain S-box-containing protein
VIFQTMSECWWGWTCVRAGDLRSRINRGQKYMEANDEAKAERLIRVGQIDLQVDEAEDILQALHIGEADAFVVAGSEGDRVYTLRSADHGYRVLVETMNEGAVILTADGVIVYCNTSLAEMLRTPLREIIGKNIRTFIVDDDLAGYQQVTDLALMRAAKREITIKAEDGTPVPSYFSLGPLMLDGVRAICGVVTDLSEQKRAQELAVSEQLERAARAQAEAANRIKDEFLATLSHELRNPINAILGWARMLAGEQQSDKEFRDHAVEVIARNARMQAQIIEDMMDVSRIIAGKFELNVDAVDLAKAAQAAIDTVRPAADDKGVHLNVSLEQSLVVSGDATRLQQVFLNLLTNSIKFTPAGGQVRVTLERTDSTARITVADTGKGIDADFLPHIFERFRQDDLTFSRKHTGLGLGLAIVHRVVQLHGGEIKAYSEGREKGSTFIVTLPI